MIVWCRCRIAVAGVQSDGRGCLHKGLSLQNDLDLFEVCRTRDIQSEELGISILFEVEDERLVRKEGARLTPVGSQVV